MNLARGCLFLLSLLFAFSLCTAQAQNDPRTVKIGFAAPLTESRVHAGLEAVRLAVDQANARAPRLNGQRIRFELLAQDDRGDARTAPLTAQYLVRSGVAAVIGHWTSTCSIAAAPVYHSARVAQLSPASTSHKLTQLGFDTTFRIMGHDDDGGANLGAYAVHTLKARRIMVVDDGTQFGMGLADQFSAAVAGNNGNIVNRNSISNKTSDFNAVLRAAKDRSADLIFLSARVNQSGEFALAMKRLNVGASLLASGGTVSTLFLAVAGAASDGVMAMEPGPALENLPGWKKLQKEFAAAGITDMGPFTVFAYDAANTVIAAILQADSSDPQKITETLHKLQYKGATGTIAFDAEGNLRNAAHTVYKVESGAWVPVKSFESGNR